MPMSTDVRLPKEQEPVFPPVCCRCLAEDPEHRVRFSASRCTWAQLFSFWIWLFRKSVRHAVPVCDACRRSVRWGKWLQGVMLVVMVALAIVLVGPWLRSMGLNRQWQKLGGFGAALVFAAPYFVWRLMRPWAFDMTVADDHVEYEFANNTYARRFAECNPGAESDDIFVPGGFDEFGDVDYPEEDATR